MNTWIAHAGLVGAGQALLLALVVLLVRGGNQRANYLLAAFLGMESIKLFGLFVFYEPIAMTNKVATLWLPLSVLSGPVLYLYIKALAEPDFRFRPRYLLHLSPWLAVLVMLAVAQGGSMAGDVVDASVSRRGGNGDNSGPIIFIITGMILIAYMIAAYRCLWQHYDRMQQALSSLQNVSLVWLRWLGCCFAVVSCC